MRKSVCSSDRLQLYATTPFKDEEDELYELHQSRRADGKRCSGKWYKSKMKKIIQKNGLKGRKPLKVSDQWRSNFCRRYMITQRRVSNKKSKSAEERLPAVKKFHRTVRSFSLPPPNRHPKYGRFPPGDRYHVDQVKLLFGGVWSHVCVCMFLNTKVLNAFL